MQVKDDVINTVSAYVGFEVGLETKLKDLKLDSLDMAELTIELDGTFNIEIPDEDTYNWITVNDIVQTVRKEL